MGVAIKHVTDPVPDIRLVVPDLSEEVGEVMRRVLAKNRDERYSSAVEFSRAFNQAVFGHPGSVQESSPTVRLIETPPARGRNKFIIGGAIGLVVLLALVFGGIKLFSSPEQEVSTPAPLAATKQEVIVPVTEALPTETEVAAFAPMCQPPADAPILALVKKTNETCTGGVPYTYYTIPKGTIFEVLDEEFKCEFVGENKGNDVIACTGKPLFNFDLKLCNPINLPELVMDSDKCQPGAGYDEANGCCVASPEEAACVIFQAGTTGCK